MTIKERAVQIYTAIGLPATIFIGLVLAVLLWYAFGGVMSTYDSYVSNKEIENLKKEADAERAKSAQFQAEAEQYKGAAAAFQQQAAEVQKQLTELANERPELQRQTGAAVNRVKEIRSRPNVPVTGDMRDRIDSLGAKLEQLERDSSN